MTYLPIYRVRKSTPPRFLIGERRYLALTTHVRALFSVSDAHSTTPVRGHTACLGQYCTVPILQQRSIVFGMAGTTYGGMVE